MNSGGNASNILNNMSIPNAFQKTGKEEILPGPVHTASELHSCQEQRQSKKEDHRQIIFSNLGQNSTKQLLNSI